MFMESVRVGFMRVVIEGHRRLRTAASVGTLTDPTLPGPSTP